MKTLGFLLLAAGAAHGQSYTTFDPPGATASSAIAINNPGQILGSYTDVAGSSHCYLRSANGATLTTIDPPAAALPGTFACSGMNNLGQIVGSFRDASGLRFYIRSASGEFTVFDPPGTPYGGAAATGINDRGEVVGTPASPPYGGVGFLRHSDGTMEVLSSSVGNIVPMSINNKGEIGGWVLNGSSQGTQHGFLRTADGVYTKYDLPGTISYTRISAVNNVGQIAGFSVSGPGFVRNADGTVLVLDQHPVNGINDSGVVVGTVFDGKTNHAYIGTPGPSSGAPKIRTGLPGAMKALALSGDRGGIAPGTWIEIYGENLAPGTRSWRTSDFRGERAPTALDGVSVTVGGVPAYVSYISPQQVNAFVPSTVTAGESQVVLTNGSGSTVPYPVYLSASSPSLFTVPLDLISGYAVGISQPVKPGDVIVLYGAGFGAVTPAVADGTVAPGPASLVASVSISFADQTGNVAAKVLYAGAAPGLVGVYQFNVVVPEVKSSFGYVTVYMNVDRGPTIGPRYAMIPVAQ
jgi:uncharacterized protein (TIGR03437 family)